ncbi:uncharacterized protein LOC115948748, partial [Geospiza fortis]|uniref:Uncharacterized protein LOC115948748 n=1 Tax=Geospiza fortis TaxID=48883 RepID=A0A8N5I2T5_GEOFO
MARDRAGRGTRRAERNPDPSNLTSQRCAVGTEAELIPISWLFSERPGAGGAGLKAAAPAHTPAGSRLLPRSVPVCHHALFPSQLKSQAPGSAEELRCLQVLNQQPEGSSLEKLSSSQGCLKLASTIKAYVATVTENIIRRSAVKEAWRNYFNTSEGQLPPKTAGKPSAHLTLRPQSLAQDGRSQRSGNLSQSCRHAITHWGHGSLVSHVQNMTYRAGRLRVEQPGKYYVDAQIYLRYRGAGRD